MTDLEKRPPRHQESASATGENVELISHHDAERDEIVQDPVSKWELRGWYGFGFATEPVSAVSITILFPLILEGLAQAAGFHLDHKTPCSADTSKPCELSLFGKWVDTSSFPLYAVSISVFLQALVFISIGALADHGSLRKKFLIGFALAGAFLSILMLAVVNETLVWLAAVIFILYNLAFSASFVFFYAYLPTLTRYHPDVLSAAVEAKEKGEEKIFLDAFERVGNMISTHGMAIGYLGAVVVFFLCIPLMFFLGSEKVYTMQIATAVTGVWWLIFLVLPIKYLKSRPGPPLPAHESYITYSWKLIFKTFRDIRQLSEAFKFLLAWFLLSDGYSTITTVAVIFGKTELKMSQLELLIAAVLAPFAALVGSYFWLAIQRLFKASTRKMTIVLLLVYSVLPLYGILGLVAPIGLKYKWEIWVAVIYQGFMLGAMQSYCRVLFSELLPKGKESEFFSLYEITDKGSAWMGPLVAGAISDATHNLRYSFIFLYALIAIPVLICLSINVVKGKKDAETWRLKMLKESSSH